MDAEELELVDSPEEPTVIFDPAKLAAQLSELLELYLARAKDALAEEQMSSKEAVACAKQVAGMLDDTQSGKLQRVDSSTEWPQLDFSRAAFVGRGPVPRRPASYRDNHGGPQVAALQDPPIQSLADAVSAVCQYDPETAILEPWAQLLARMNQLTQRLSADIEEWKASCEQQPPPERVGRAHQPGSSADAERDRSGDLQVTTPSKSRDLETCPPGRVASPAMDSGTGVGGTGVPPVIPPNPAPSRTGGARVPALQEDSASVEKPTTNTCPPESRKAGRRRNQQPASGHT